MGLNRFSFHFPSSPLSRWLSGPGWLRLPLALRAPLPRRAAPGGSRPRSETAPSTSLAPAACPLEANECADRSGKWTACGELCIVRSIGLVFGDAPCGGAPRGGQPEGLLGGVSSRQRCSAFYSERLCTSRRSRCYVMARLRTPPPRCPTPAE